MNASTKLTSAAGLHIGPADLESPVDQQAILDLLNNYAARLIGHYAELPQEVARELIPALQAHPASYVLLAKLNQQPLGIATCFLGFSTFRARPLLNLHDLAVHSDFQRQGLGGLLLEAVCDFARQLHCCAVTLEVQANNPARRLYAAHGFVDLTTPMHAETSLFAKRMLD